MRTHPELVNSEAGQVAAPVPVVQRVRNASGRPKEDRERFVDAVEELVALGIDARMHDAIIDSRYYGSSVFLMVSEGDPRFQWDVIQAGSHLFYNPAGFISNRQPNGVWQLHSGMEPETLPGFVTKVRESLDAQAAAIPQRRLRVA